LPTLRTPRSVGQPTTRVSAENRLRSPKKQLRPSKAWRRTLRSRFGRRPGPAPTGKLGNPYCLPVRPRPVIPTGAGAHATAEWRNLIFRGNQASSGIVDGEPKESVVRTRRACPGRRRRADTRADGRKITLRNSARRWIPSSLDIYRILPTLRIPRSVGQRKSGCASPIAHPERDISGHTSKFFCESQTDRLAQLLKLLTLNIN
jgi:hypothetical protein